jgi:uncharacterized iron-regulated protein
MWLAAACTPSTFAWDDAVPATLQGYRAAFAEAVGTELRGSLTREELLLEIGKNRVLWLGDHHSSSRLHGLQLQLLDDLHNHGRRLVLALEAIGLQDEPQVREYLAGELTMESLRQQMRARWNGSWLDDRELDPWHYRSLLAFAKNHQLPVVALEPTPRLRLSHRDEVLETNIRRALDEHEDRLVVVVVGQAHLVGQGDLIERIDRSGCRSIAIGGEPPPSLRGSAPGARGSVQQSQAGLWWFAELFPGD